jgi:hypothetical protein
MALSVGTVNNPTLYVGGSPVSTAPPPSLSVGQANGMQPGYGSILQGTNPNLQGTSPNLQGSSPYLQGSSFSPQAAGSSGPLYSNTSTGSGSAGAGNGGDTGGGGTQTAAQSAQSALTSAMQKNIQDSLNATRQSIYGTIGTTATQFGSSIQDQLDQLKTQQEQIDQQRVQNELSRMQGRQGVLDMVGNGIRSGAITLDNANASNSSAADAYNYTTVAPGSLSGTGPFAASLPIFTLGG